MTPEPNDGIYAQERVESFVRRFGHPTTNDTLYFTGLHRVGERSQATGLSLHHLCAFTHVV
jgi:hypothetical protein